MGTFVPEQEMKSAACILLGAVSGAVLPVAVRMRLFVKKASAEYLLVGTVGQRNRFASRELSVPASRTGVAAFFREDSETFAESIHCRSVLRGSNVRNTDAANREFVRVRLACLRVRGARLGLSASATSLLRSA